MLKPMNSEPRYNRRAQAVVLAGAVVCLAFATAKLRSGHTDLNRIDTDVDGVPVTVLTPSDGPKAPAVVIAHGFAGCRQLMQAVGFTLARSGYVAVTFDFPGHGDHPLPLGGTLGSPARTTSLHAALRTVIDYARKLETSDGRVALVGHSMAGEILVLHATEDPNVEALVGLSPYLAKPPPADALGAPLLVAYGGWEGDFLMDMGRRAVAEAADDVAPNEIEPGRAYGSSAKRALEIIDNAEHIGILFAPDALRATVAWIDDAVGRTRSEGVPVQPRRIALGAWYLGVLLLGFVLILQLPRVSTAPAGANLRGRRFVAAACLPAILTPVLLAPIPTDFLPSILTDYIALHFLTYGVLTFAVLSVLGLRGGDLVRSIQLRPFIIALSTTLLFELTFLGVATDRFLSMYFPGPNRAVATAAAFVGAVVWFVADEWLTRGPRAQKGAYALTKMLFVSSLVFAVVLNPNELFFLVLIIPAMLALFIVYGVLSRWIGRQTGHPLVAAVAHALAFALAVSATFPVVD